MKIHGNVKYCKCGHWKSSHNHIMEKGRRLFNVGKCRLPNCQCKEYKTK